MINDSFHIASVSNDRFYSNSISIEKDCYAIRMTDHDLDTPYKRLKWARERAGYKSAQDYADRKGVLAVTYRSYENGTNGFAKSAPKFARDFGVDTEWLMVGGPINEDGDFEGRHNFAVMRAAEDLGIEMIRQVDISYAMGDGAVIQDYPETGLFPFAKNFLTTVGVRSTENLFLCRGEGDSMAPTIFDNDLVLIDASLQRITMQDRIWALTVAGAGMVKRVRALPTNQFLVMSDNPSVSDQVYDADDVFIVGKVIWIGRRM